MSLNRIEKRGSGLYLTGYDRGNTVKSLSTDDAKKLGDLRLHLSDMQECIATLEGIRKASESEELKFLLKSAWQAAVIIYARCFIGGVRESLDRSAVFADEPKAIEVHQYIIDIRHKFVAHDVNRYRDAEVMLLIDDQITGVEVIDVVSMVQEAGVDRLHLDQLYKLASHVTDYVSRQAGCLHDKIVNEQRARSASELRALPESKFTVPTMNEVGRRR